MEVWQVAGNLCWHLLLPTSQNKGPYSAKSWKICLLGMSHGMYITMCMFFASWPVFSSWKARNKPPSRIPLIIDCSIPLVCNHQSFNIGSMPRTRRMLHQLLLYLTLPLAMISSINFLGLMLICHHHLLHNQPHQFLLYLPLQFMIFNVQHCSTHLAFQVKICLSQFCTDFKLSDVVFEKLHYRMLLRCGLCLALLECCQTRLFPLL